MALISVERSIKGLDAFLAVSMDPSNAIDRVTVSEIHP